MSKRNLFVRHSRVKFRLCDDPNCKCGGKFVPGEEGTVRSALGRLIKIELPPYEGVMTRFVHVRKEVATAHLERLDLPVKKAVPATK